MAANPPIDWHCTNPACRQQVTGPAFWVDGQAPLCACGFAMKKSYRPPVFRYLEFLTLDDPEPAHDRAAEK